MIKQKKSLHCVLLLAFMNILYRYFGTGHKPCILVKLPTFFPIFLLRQMQCLTVSHKLGDFIFLNPGKEGKCYKG